MTDVLVYWRDCRRNRADRSTGGAERRWHSSAAVMGALEPGDRLWLVAAGQHLGLRPAHRGFLIETWRVAGSLANPGDDAAYPPTRYAHRVEACIADELTPHAPIDVDDIIRPADSSASAPIGRLLQGPRRLHPRLADRLARATRPGGEGSSVVAASDDSGTNGLDAERIALGVRQPWAELILQGIKTIEVRTLPITLRGTIYLYSSKLTADIPAARQAAKRHGLEMATLPLGAIVGSVDITGCRRCVRQDAGAACVPADLLSNRYGWELANPLRLAAPVRPRFLPYGVWFYPFRRRNGDVGHE